MKRVWCILTALVLAPGLLPAQESATPLRLTLRDAIEMGLKSNLGVQVAGTQADEAAGTAERRRSALYPRVTASHTTSYQNRNLQAFGVSIPGSPLPTVVGPFSNYDYRVFASQPIIDRQALHAARASERMEQAAKLSYQDVRDQAIRQSAGLYLDAQAAAALVEAAEARKSVSEILVKSAQNLRASGMATGVDVVRANVQERRDQQQLLVARVNYENSLLVLQRFLGIRPGTRIVLADQLGFHPIVPPSLEEALPSALAARADYASLLAQRDGLAEQLRASRSRYLPKLSIDGNYGVLGRSYGTMPATGTIQASLAVTVFDRDRSGEQKEINSRLQRLDAQMADLRHGIELELRRAGLNLASTEQQVGVTQSAIELAQKEVELVRDRFSNGLTSNVEVVTALASLQAAQDDHILALARYEDAVISLVRAMGATRENYEKYLGGGSVGRPQTNPGQEAPRQ